MNQHVERRLFFAALPDQASRDALLAATARCPKHRRLRWLAQENWHLTLRFVGNVSASLVTPLSEALAACAQRHPPTMLALRHIEPFPSAAKPLVLAATGRADAVTRNLVMDLEQRCRALGLAAVEQTFRAHLSLARVCGRRAFEVQAEPLSLMMPINRITLMESVPGERGRRYLSITSAELARPR